MVLDEAEIAALGTTGVRSTSSTLLCFHSITGNSCMARSTSAILLFAGHSREGIRVSWTSLETCKGYLSNLGQGDSGGKSLKPRVSLLGKEQNKDSNRKIMGPQILIRIFDF